MQMIGFKKMAERVGFEPTLEFPLNTLSKRAPSATRPSLRTRVRPIHYSEWHGLSVETRHLSRLVLTPKAFLGGGFLFAQNLRRGSATSLRLGTGRPKQVLRSGFRSRRCRAMSAIRQKDIRRRRR